MKKNYVARRRGTSIAAAAMTFAIVAPFAQPVAAPQFAAAAHAEMQNAKPGRYDAPEDAWLQATTEELKAGLGEYAPPKPGDKDPAKALGNPFGWRHVYWQSGGKVGQTQPVKTQDGSFDIDAIASGQIYDGGQLPGWGGAAYDVVSGRSTIVSPRMGGQLTSVYPGFESLPEGQRVYLQWIDQDGAVSPVYSATTHDLPGLGSKGGAYAFAVPQWIDNAGKKHRYITGLNQRLRIWIEPEVNPETGNVLVPLRNEPGYIPLAFGNGGGGDKIGSFAGKDGTNGNLTKTGVWAYELPLNYQDSGEQNKDSNYMDVRNTQYDVKDEQGNVIRKGLDRYYEDVEGPIKNPTLHLNQVFGNSNPNKQVPSFVQKTVKDADTGEDVEIGSATIKRTISGQVWLENGNERQLFSGATPTANAPAVQYRVYASALTDEGAAKYDQEVASLDPALRAKATKLFLAENPQYLAGTVSGLTDEEGNYTLRFPEPIFKNAMRAGLYDQFQDHLYMWVEDSTGEVLPIPDPKKDKVVPTYSTWTQPVFTNPRLNLQWTPTVDPSANNTGARSRFINTNFAVVPSNNIKLDITNYNMLDKPAKRGSTAKVELRGDLPSTQTNLEWRDSRGNVVKRCENITDVKDLKGCESFVVPNTANNGDVFTAVLVTGGEGFVNVIAADSFIVRVDGPAWGEKIAPETHDPVVIPNVGSINAKGEGDDLPDLTKTPANPALPNTGDIRVVVKDNAGKEITDYTVEYDNARGDLKFTPGDTVDVAKPNEYTINVEKYDFVLDANGEKQLKPGMQATDPDPYVRDWQLVDDAKVIYDSVKNAYDAEYKTYFYKFPGSTRQWNNATTEAPKFYDQNGNPLKNPPTADLRKQNGDPKGKTVDAFTLGHGGVAWTSQWKLNDGTVTPAVWNAPAGQAGSISINSQDGKITFIPADETLANSAKAGADWQAARERLAGATTEIPVTVTYKDGSTDEIWAKIGLGDGDKDKYDLKYGTVNVSKEETKEIKPEFKDLDGNPAAIPANAKFSLDKKADGSEFADKKGVAEGGYVVKVDEKTGVVTVTGPENVDQNTPEKLEIPVLLSYSDRTEGRATATVLLDTDGDGIPDIDDTDDDNDGVTDEQEKIDGTDPKDATSFLQASRYTPGYTPATGAPDTTVTVSAPTFTSKGQLVEKLPGVKFEADTIDHSDPNNPKENENFPKGVKVNEKTGEIEVAIPENAVPGSVIAIPVKVTYPDHDQEAVDAGDKQPSVDYVTAYVTVIAPEEKGLNVLAIRDLEVPVNTPIKEIPVTATFDGVRVGPNDPKKTKFDVKFEQTDPKNPVNGLKFENGVISGTPDKVGEVKVTVTATRGGEKSVEKFDIKVTNTKIINLDEDADNDKLTNGDEFNGTKNPYGTPQPGADGKLVSEKIEDGKPGAPTNPFAADTDGDGISDGDEINRVDKDGKPAPTDPNNPDTDGDGVNDGDEQKWGTDPNDKNSVPPTIVPGAAVDTVVKGEKKVLDDTVKNAVPGKTEATVVDGNGNTIGTATIDGDKITVNIPTDKPEGPAQVVVTHPGADGKPQEVGRIDIVVVRPGTRAVEFTPSYGDPANVKPGKDATVVPTWKDDKKPEGALESTAGEKSVGADDWTISTDDKTGEVKATAPSNDQVKAEYERLFPNGAGTWEAFVAGFTNYARPTETVTFTYDDGSQNIAKAQFDLIGKDGKSILDPTGDFDGDGVDNKTEIEQNTNPFDENSKSGIKPGTKIDDVKAGDQNGTKLDDKVTNPTEGMTGIVRDKDGNKIENTEVKVDPNTGEITVKLPENATPGIGSVQITDKDGDPVGNPILINIVAPDPSITAGDNKDQITAGTDTELDDTVKNPTTGMTGEVIGKDENGNDKKIEGATVTIDPVSGEITVRVPEGTDAQDAEVVIKDKNGNQVGDPIDVIIVKPAPTLTPGTTTDKLTPGTEAKLDDRVANPTEDMTGEVIGKDGKKIEGASVTVDPTTGDIKVTVPEGTDPQDATVIIKDKNGNQVGDPIKVEIIPVAPSVTNDQTAANEVPADGLPHTITEKVTNPTTGLTGEVKEIPGATVIVDPTTGEITVTVPKETEPQDATVVIKDREGNQVGEELTIKIVEPAKYTPDYGDKKTGVTPGGNATTVNPFSETKAPVTNVEAPTPAGAEDWKFEPIGTTGVIKGDAPSQSQLEAKVGDQAGKTWDEFVKNLTPFAEPTVTVNFTYTNGDENNANAEFAIVGKDGKSILDPSGDFDGDGVDNKTEWENKTDLLDPNSKPSDVKDNGTKDAIPADGNNHKVEEKVTNPTDGLTGTVVDPNTGKEITGPNGEKPVVAVDPNSGEITVKVPVGTEPTTDAQIVITDPNNGGKQVGEPIQIEITKPAPTLDNKNTIDDVVAGKPGGTKLDDKVNNPTDGMGGKVYDKDGNEIPGSKVTVDPNTCEITVFIPEGTKPGIARVEITDKHGNKVGETLINVVGKPSVTDGTQGNQQVPADGNGHKLDDKVQNPTEGMTGTVTGQNGNLIDRATATVDPTTGEVTVTVPKGTEPGEATVTIKDKDGNAVGEVKIEITNQADQNQPNYGGATKVPAGQSANTNDPFAGKNAPVAKVDVTKQDAAKDWTFTPVGTSGVINATAPTNEQISQAIKDTFGAGGVQGKDADAKWKNFVNGFKGYAQPEVGVTVTYTDDSTDGATAGFDLVGKDGKSILDPNGDFDGDGVSNKVEIGLNLDPTNPDTDGDGVTDGQEIIDGTDPLDPNSFKGNAAPSLVIGGNYAGTVGQKIDPILVTSDKDATVHVTNLPEGLTFDAATGNITGTPKKAGTKKVTVTAAKNGQTTTREVTFNIADGKSGNAGGGVNKGELSEEQLRKCIITSVGVGLPLLALIPIGLATQVAIPGLTPMVEEISAQLELANANFQQQLDIFNPGAAQQVVELNARLRAAGTDLAGLAAGLALVAAGILSTTLIITQCTEQDGTTETDVKAQDTKVNGSSGKEYKSSENGGSSK